MFEGLIGTIAIVALIIVAVRQNKPHRPARTRNRRAAQLRAGKARPSESSKLAAAPAERVGRRHPTRRRREAAAATTDSRTVRTLGGARTLGGRRVGIRGTRRHGRRPSIARRAGGARGGKGHGEKARHRDRARHALGGLGRRTGAGARRPLPHPLFDRGRHFRPRRAADHGRPARPGAGRRRRVHPPHRLQGAGRGRGRRLCAGHPDRRRRLHAVRHGLCRAWHLRLHRPDARLPAARRHRRRHDRGGAGAWPGAGRHRPARLDDHAGAGLVAVAERLGAVRLSGDRAGRQHRDRAPARLEVPRGGRLRRHRPLDAALSERGAGPGFHGGDVHQPRHARRAGLRLAAAQRRCRTDSIGRRSRRLSSSR